MLGETQNWRWIAEVLDGALAFTCGRIVLAWPRSGSARRRLAAGLRLIMSGVVGVDDVLRDAPALGNLAPAGPGPLPDGAGLLPARAAGAFAPAAAPGFAGCGSELGQLLLHGCLVLLRQVDLIGGVSQRERHGGGVIRAVEVIYDQSFRRHDDI